jgi:hypothetical protein
LLGAERIGHGIAAIHDPELMDLLAERNLPLEICPGSNMKTAALARQLGREDARIEDHPLPKLLRHGIPIVLSTDDPASFTPPCTKSMQTPRAWDYRKTSSHESSRWVSNTPFCLSAKSLEHEAVAGNVILTT